MEANSRSTSQHPTSSGLICLQARSTSLVTWLGPAWAVLCGVAASGNFDWQGQDWLRLSLVILLVDGGWSTLWTALGETDWATPLRRWRQWRSGERLATPPYTLSGSPGDVVSRWLGQLRAWWHDVFWPACGSALLAAVVALPVISVLGALLGIELVLLSIATLATVQLGVAWEGGRGSIAPGWDAIIAVTFPWLAGHAAFGSLTLSSAALALAFALPWGAAWRADRAWGRALGMGTQLVAAALLVALHHPLAASTLLLLTGPQMAMFPWLRRGHPPSNYVRYARPWLMGAMLVAAWAL